MATPPALTAGATGAVRHAVIAVQPDGSWIATVPVRGGGTLRFPLPPLRPGQHYDASTITAQRLPGPAKPGSADQSRAAPVAAQATAEPKSRSGPLDAREYPGRSSPASGTVTTIAGGSCDGYPATEATISPMHVSIGRNGRLVWTDDDSSRGPDPQINSYWFWVRPERVGHDQSSQTVREIDGSGRVRTMGSQYAAAGGRIWRNMAAEGVDASSLFTAIPDEHGGTLINVDVPEGPGAVTANPSDVPAANAIVDIAARGTRTLVVGGQPLSASDASSHSSTYGDGQPATNTVLGTVQSFTTDERGNIYLADSVVTNASGVAGYVRIRFVNRSHDAVTFYRGTPLSTTIQPGTIGTIAGPGTYPLIGPAGVTTNPRGTVDGSPSGNGLPAKTATFAVVPKLVVRSDVLYLLDQFHLNVSTDDRSNLEIRAINLGLTRSGPLTVAGTPIPVGNIDRVAGDDTTDWGYAGDGGPARSAKFNVERQVGPTGDFAVDDAGNIYISDSNNNRVRRVDALTGIIVTVAGNGIPSSTPANGPALVTSLNEPFGITIDRHNRPVFAEYLGKVIRRLDATAGGPLAMATVTTIAGRGATPCGDGHLAAGRTPFAGARFGQVYDVASDRRGDIFVADGEYETVRRISPSGRIDEVIGQAVPCAGPIRSPQLECPSSGPQSNDPGPITAARLANPNYVLPDTYDNLYISDVDRVRYVNFLSRPVTVQGVKVAPRSIASIQVFPGRRVSVSLGFPPVNFTVTQPIGGLALDPQGQLYVADPFLDVVYRIGRCGESGVVAGNGRPPTDGGQGDGGQATTASLIPQALHWDTRRNALLISTDPVATGPALGTASNPQPEGSARIRAVNLSRESIVVFGRRIAPGDIETIAGGGRCVQSGCSYGDGGSAVSAAISTASGMAAGPGGRLYIVDSAANRIRVILPNGTIAGISSPWREIDSCTGCTHSLDAPDGYRGDGGRAIDAWFDFRLEWQPGQQRPSIGAVAVTPRGDLLVGDHSGRIRKIVDPLHAPLRLTSSAPAVPGSGAGMTALTPLYEGATAATSVSGYTQPDGGSALGAEYVTAARGAGRGCDLWRVRMSNGEPQVEFLGQPTSPALGVGGSSCQLAATSRLVAVAAPIRTDDTGLANGGADAGVDVASSPDGATWRSGIGGLVPLRAGNQLGRVAFTSVAGDLQLAYRTSDGAVVVTSSPDGTVWAGSAETAVAANSVVLGDLVAGRGSARLLALVTTGGSVIHPRHAVVVVRSDASNRWSQTSVASISDTGGGALSPPSLAVDVSGTAYVAWSDDHAVYLSHSRDGTHWTPPRKISTTAAALPTVVAGSAGRIAVGYYAAPNPTTTTAADPYGEWYVAISTSSDAANSGARFTTRLATAGAVHYGALCMAYDTCPGTASGTGATSPAYGTGVVRLIRGGDGRVAALATIDAGLLTNSSAVPVVGYVRDCLDHLTPASTHSACHPRRTSAQPSPALATVPQPPTVPKLPLASCAPLPPRPQPTATAAPHRQHRPGHAPGREGNHPLSQQPDHRPAGLAPFVPEPPVEPALPGGQAPMQANAISNAQQPVAQHQGGIQPGIAAAEEKQVRHARSFAYGGPPDGRHGSPHPIELYWLATSGFVGCGVVALRRRSAALRTTASTSAPRRTSQEAGR